MGGTCNSQPHPTFTQSLKYHSTEHEKISNTMTPIYSYKEIFVQQKEYNMVTKQELQQQIKKLSVCIKCPIGVQSILKYQTTRVLLPCSDLNVCSGRENQRGCSNNYRVVVYAEHLCFSFREHLQGLRWKGLWLSQKEVFYVAREIVTAAKFIWGAGYKVTSFDPNSLYLSTTYQLKIPFQHITPQSTSCPPSTYPSPQQLQPIIKSNQTDQSSYSYSSQQSSIFSVGMLLLECITMLDSIVYYYNLHRKFIYVDRYQKQIRNISNQVLREMLSGMLEVEPGKRMSWRELGRMLDGLGEDMFQNYLIID